MVRLLFKDYIARHPLKAEEFLMAPFPDETTQGIFVQQEDTFDFSSLDIKTLDSPEFKAWVTRLTNRINQMSISLNQKDTGIYDTTQIVNGQTYFADPALTLTSSSNPIFRQVFRITLDVGPLQNPVTTVLHGITVTDSTTFTRFYGAASNTTAHEYIPLPFVNVGGTFLAGDIEIAADDTNVYITAGADPSAFNKAYIVIEFLQN